MLNGTTPENQHKKWGPNWQAFFRVFRAVSSVVPEFKSLPFAASTNRVFSISGGSMTSFESGSFEWKLIYYLNFKIYCKLI